jgi:nucleotide-binding universal stress UspA family protein
MGAVISNCVLVPFDFSSHSTAAVDKALQWVDSPGQVHVLHVLPFMIPTEPGVVWATIDDGQRIKHALDALNDTLSDPKYDGVVREVLLGDAGHVVCDRAEELGADMVVLPSHGRTGLSRLFLGSVAERVVRLCKCPVLVLKLPAGS